MNHHTPTGWTRVPTTQDTQDPQRQSPERPKRRRIFLWVFLALQALFLVWVITGAASGSGNTTDAQNTGTAIGVGLIVGLWAAVDIIVGGTYAVYRLSTRRPK